MDILGPIRGDNCLNRKFVIVYYDDYSKFIYLDFIKSKDDNIIQQSFKQYINWGERHSNSSILRIQSDNGTEFVAMSKLLEEMRISHEKSLPYTPAQNGRAERAIQTISQATRTCLMDSNLPFWFLPEAMRISVHTSNRTTNSNFQSSYELLMNVEPRSLNYLRRFVCIS
jgi:transposase InsO family protein